MKNRHLLSIQVETIAAVKSFYTSDDISRMAPGKRDVITVRNEDGKQKLQKRHLYMTIKEAYAIFKTENPDIKLGLSKFADLRPPNVLLSSQTPANVCTCVYHQNMFLALDAIHCHIPSIPSYNTEFPASCIVDPGSDACWFGECKQSLWFSSQIFSSRGYRGYKSNLDEVVRKQWKDGQTTRNWECTRSLPSHKCHGTKISATLSYQASTGKAV